MKKSLVSILMPVYNSFDFTRSENENLLPKALDSILSQTYKNFELIILDNQSIDDTADICQKYADKDSRVRYIRDTQKRYPEGGITQAATMVNGEFTMVANDDDIWHPEYIQKMVSYLTSHPEAEMCYSNGNFIDIKGNSVGLINISNKYKYQYENSPISNFSNYLLKRNPIPLAFGVFRSNIYAKILPFEDFDALKADVDNLFILKSFLLGLKCHYINEPLFFYRKKSRKLDPKKIPDMPGLETPVLIGLYYIKHQLIFNDVVLNKAKELLPPNENQLNFIIAAILRGFLVNSSNLPRWISNYTDKNNKKEVAVRKAALQTMSILKKLLKNYPEFGNFTDDYAQQVRFEPILTRELLRTSLVGLTSMNDLVCVCKKEIKANELINSVLILFEKTICEVNIIIKKLDSVISTTPEILGENNSVIKLSSTPKLSIITASMNLAALVEETMNSVKNQSSIDYEHIVIDGGSTDMTLKILKKYPHIKLISEKDSGYPDAFLKGLKMAKGQYIMQCAISDGYANKDWIKMCIETLDENKDISLVWGFPGRLTEDSKLVAIARSQFHYDAPPNEEKFFNYWLTSYFVYPEGNLCVRKNVMEKCYPTLDNINNDNILDWLEFSFRFNKFGYVAKCIPIMANFGRTHGNQLGEKLGNDGSLKKKYNNYRSKLKNYRNKLLLGTSTHHFIDSNGSIISNRAFDRNQFIKEYVSFIAHNLFHIDKKYFMISRYKAYLRRTLKI